MASRSVVPAGRWRHRIDRPSCRAVSSAASRGLPAPAWRIPAPTRPTSDGCPADTWATASLPVGVRLEFIGAATAIDIEYETLTGDLGYRGEGAGTTFSVWRDGVVIDERPVLLGLERIRLSLGGHAASGAARGRVIVYLPKG